MWGPYVSVAWARGRPPVGRRPRGAHSNEGRLKKRHGAPTRRFLSLFLIFSRSRWGKYIYLLDDPVAWLGWRLLGLLLLLFLLRCAHVAARENVVSCSDENIDFLPCAFRGDARERRSLSSLTVSTTHLLDSSNPSCVRVVWSNWGWFLLFAWHIGGLVRFGLLLRSLGQTRGSSAAAAAATAAAQVERAPSLAKRRRDTTMSHERRRESEPRLCRRSRLESRRVAAIDVRACLWLCGLLMRVTVECECTRARSATHRVFELDSRREYETRERDRERERESARESGREREKDFWPRNYRSELWLSRCLRLPLSLFHRRGSV